MNRAIETWTVQKLLNLLANNSLNYKPAIQRQFVYSKEQQQQVIASIKKGFIASALVVEMESPGHYVLLDGKQRVNSIIGFINKAFSIDSFYFDDSYRTDVVNPGDRYRAPKVLETEVSQTDNSDSARLLRFTFPVVIYSDMTPEERLALFNVINTTGEKLNSWELISGRYPSGVLLDMRANYFNEIAHTNTVTLNTSNSRVLKFEKYFGTHEVNRGELYIKIIEKLYQLSGGTLDDQPYEIIDGIRINTKNYNRLCRFIEAHQSESFAVFASELISKIELFYEMFKDIGNLGVLKEACFNIGDFQLFKDNESKFKTDEIKDNLIFLISQYINSDLRKAIKDHAKYFEENILPLALIMKPGFRATLDTKRYYSSQDKERLFIRSRSYNASTHQVKCEGVMNDGATPCGCGRMIGIDEATVDHIVPWILGGKTDDDNAQILCSSCNSAKGSSIISGIFSRGGLDDGE